MPEAEVDEECRLCRRLRRATGEERMHVQQSCWNMDIHTIRYRDA